MLPGQWQPQKKKIESSARQEANGGEHKMHLTIPLWWCHNHHLSTMLSMCLNFLLGLFQTLIYI